MIDTQVLPSATYFREHVLLKCRTELSCFLGCLSVAGERSRQQSPAVPSTSHTHCLPVGGCLSKVLTSVVKFIDLPVPD